MRATAERPLTIRGEAGAGRTIACHRRQECDHAPDARFVERVPLRHRHRRNVDSPYRVRPAHIIIENLDVTGAHPENHFFGSNGLQRYSEAASAIYVESGTNITIRNCILRESGNGFFSAFASSDVLVEGCDIHSNGIAGSDRHHNAYSASAGMTYQFNRFGRLAPAAKATISKIARPGLIVRYNWIDGGSRQLDLVDAEDSEHLVNDPRYSRTYVYGNVLIERSGHYNNQIVHYGGDSGNEEIYRKGILYFFNNTVVSERRDSTTLMRLSTQAESAQIRNNVIYTTGDGTTFSLMDDSGVATFANNWIKAGWIESRSGSDWVGRVIANDNIEGLLPGFVDFENEDFRPAVGSPLIDASKPFTIGGNRELPVDWEFAAPRGARKRPHNGPLDLGAFEHRR